jgi:FkbM family methyltransferase
MKIISIVKNIIQHPMNRNAPVTALWRFFKWQIFAKIIGYPVVFPFVGKCVLIIEKGMAGATGNIYNGLHEHNDMLFAIHFLREEDLFIDVGANVGVYTVLAAAHCGAQVISFEPIPETHSNLKRNVLVNDIHERVLLINKAAAGEEKSVYFTSTLDAGNHALYQEDSIQGQRIKIDCTTLDLVTSRIPNLIKIDVEGFETEVIEGAKKILSGHELKAIIIELNGSGKRYGYNEENIHHTLLSYGFLPYFYNSFNRKIELLEHWGTHNSIYIRDLAFVENRIKSAPPIRINNLSL